MRQPEIRESGEAFRKRGGKHTRKCGLPRLSGAGEHYEGAFRYGYTAGHDWGF